MFQIRRGIQQGSHLFVAHYGREFSPDLGLDNLLDEPLSLQRLRVEEFERGDSNLQSGPSDLLLMYQVQLILANIFRPQILWRLVEEPGEVCHARNIRTDRQPAKLPQPRESMSSPGTTPI